MSHTKGLLDVLKDFAGGTSIHGLAYVVDNKKSVTTRLFWAIVFSSLIIYASIELRNSILCKRFDNTWIKRILFWNVYDVSYSMVYRPNKFSDSSSAH